jgi:hypothetical protein
MMARVVLIAVVLMTIGWPGVGAAQDTPIVIEGHVDWIAGEVMVIAPNGLFIAPGGTSAINIDLSRVDQDEYSGLAEGDAVIVTGVILRAKNRVLATSIQRAD